MRLFKATLLLMLVASIVPVLVVGWRSVDHTGELLVRDAQELAQERVNQIRLKTQLFLDEPVRATEGLAKIPGFLERPADEQRLQLAAILNQRREVTALTLFDVSRKKIPGLQGFAVQDVSPAHLAAHDQRADELLFELTGIQYSPVYTSPSGAPMVTFAFPFGDPVKGYAAAEMSLEELASQLTSQRVGSSGYVYLVDRKGRFIAGRPGADTPLVGQPLSERPVVKRLVEATQSFESDSLRVGNFGQGKDAVVAAYGFLPGTGWAVIAEQPLAQAYGQVASMRKRILFILLGAMGIALVLAGVFSRGLTKPLKAFTSGALELASGKFGVQVPVATKNELGELAQTFNYMSQQLMAYDMENKGLYQSLENGYLETIVALANSIDSKDSYTRGHSQRVADVAVDIGRELQMPEGAIKWLRYGGILHDIGKIGIVEQILCKQSRLTDEEMVVMRTHPEIGDQIVEPVSFLSQVRAAIRNHHERWDGTGYPDKLAGEKIPLVARIVNCADTFDACTSTRPYQKAMTIEKTLEILENLRGKQLDPKVLDALIRVIEKKGVRIEGKSSPVKLAS